MKGYPIDVKVLHSLLFRRADSLGRLKFSQKGLADELDVAPETMCRVLKRMGDQGRLRRIGAKKNNIGVYIITDPDEFLASDSKV